jgi:hypothetical protein
VNKDIPKMLNENEPHIKVQKFIREPVKIKLSAEEKMEEKYYH